MRVFITGGAGFIGSHLADAYIARGDEVSILDDLSTGSINNIRHLKSNPKFHYTVDSVHNPRVVAELIDECDIVYHLAAAVGVKLIVESPVRTIETNVHGTEVVLAQAAKKKRIVRAKAQRRKELTPPWRSCTSCGGERNPSAGRNPFAPLREPKKVELSHARPAPCGVVSRSKGHQPGWAERVFVMSVVLWGPDSLLFDKLLD